MYTVCSCFATTFAFLIVTIDWRAAEAVVCCNSTSVASSGGDIVASCQNKNRTFHRIETYGVGTCDDNRTAVPVRKCCPLGQVYDLVQKKCYKSLLIDGDENLKRMIRMILQLMYIPWYEQEVVMVGYKYNEPLCDAGDMQVYVPTGDMSRMLKAYSSASELPPGYCFDLTSSDELVARTCQAAAVVCCDSSSVASSGGDIVASCQNKNRTFHKIETYGVGTCDDNRTAVPVRKCCPLGQVYNLVQKKCYKSRLIDSDENLKRMIRMILQLIAPWDEQEVVMVGYKYNEPLCDAGDMQVYVPTGDMSRMLKAYSSASELPPGYCFDLTSSDELVARTCQAAAVVCCDSSSVASGGGDVVASCQNKNRTFHRIETFGVGTCDDNRTAWPVRKCCPLGQLYNMEWKKCARSRLDDDEHLKRMMWMMLQLTYGSRRLMVGYNYEQPLCDAWDMLVSVPTDDMSRMLKAYSSASELPPGYCFDLTSSDELVARTCHGTAVVCCNSSSVASSGGDVVASCQNKNRTFHTIHAFGGSTCDDNRMAVPIRKCCPLGQSYDAIKKLCRPDGVDGDEQMRRMIRTMLQLTYGSWEAQDVLMVGYIYEQPLCEAGEMLVDVPTVVLKMMMRTYWSASDLPPEYCFDLTPSDELVARRCQPTVVVCCNSSSVESASRDVVASCQNENRTFHTIEALGRGTCDDNRAAVPIRKCCPLGQSYDVIKKLCRPDGVDGDEQMRWMMSLLSYLRLVPDAVMVGYNYEGLLCDYPYELLRQPDILYVLLKSKPSKFPEERCFDLSPSGELEGGLCMRSEHCLNNTCVHRCCKGDRMIVDGPNGPECTLSEKPFTMSAYRIEEDGRLVGLSNRTVLPYYVEFKCSHRDMLNYGFQLTEDGSLYLTYEHHIVPHTEYCVGYSQVTDSIVAFICDADFVYMVERARSISIPILCRASYVASAVCLAFTLLVYNTLPSLRNNRNYYVKCYMSHQFVSYIIEIAQMSMENKKGHTCVLFGYITLFVFLSTLCWLNVICFDIYWMIRYNISINRNTSTSERTIMYHFYSWGLSSIFVCTGLVFKYSQDESLQKFAPDFGEYGCVYYHMSSYRGLIFILMPMSVMLTANLIFFLLTAIHYSRIKSELNNFNPTDLKTENVLVYKDKFVMSIKLFLIIGIPYSLTVLSIILRIEETKWKIIYAASSLQGVLIFIIFILWPSTKLLWTYGKKFKGSNMDHSEPTQINLISGSS